MENLPPSGETHTYAVPQTRKEKLANFWYHYKWFVIAAVFVLILVVSLLVNILSKPTYDNSFIIISEKSFTGSQYFIKEPLEKMSGDVNGDGKILVKVMEFQLATGEGNAMTPQMQDMSYAKIIGEISDRREFVFMLDEEGYRNLKSVGIEFEDISSFTGEDEPQGDKYPLKGTELSKKLGLNKLLDKMYLCFADFDTYSERLRESKEMQQIHETQRAFFKALVDCK